MESFTEAMTNWSTLSSEGLIGELLGFAGVLGEWAEAAAKLIGLVA